MVVMTVPKNEALVRRFTWSRTDPLRQTVQDHLRRG